MALPEFYGAAGHLAQAAKEGQFSGFPGVPKFFILSCEGDEVRSICDEQAGNSFPEIVLFRSKVAIHFERPRTAQVLTWWAHRMSRPVITRVETVEHMRTF